jgi:hypothetical protein
MQKVKKKKSECPGHDLLIMMDNMYILAIGLGVLEGYVCSIAHSDIVRRALHVSNIVGVVLYDTLITAA